jgi:hypothetical protein
LFLQLLGTRLPIKLNRIRNMLPQFGES